MTITIHRKWMHRMQSVHNMVKHMTMVFQSFYLPLRDFKSLIILVRRVTHSNTYIYYMINCYIPLHTHLCTQYTADMDKQPQHRCTMHAWTQLKALNTTTDYNTTITTARKVRTYIHIILVYIYTVTSTAYPLVHATYRRYGQAAAASMHNACLNTAQGIKYDHWLQQHDYYRAQRTNIYTYYTCI